VLVLPVLLGANACLPHGDAGAAKRFRQLSLPLIGLLGAVMASALGRMALYVKYYGLSTDRIDATAFMGWLAIVFVLFVLTVLRGRPTRFAGGMLVSGLGVLFALNVASPDAIVARVNLNRAMRGAGPSLDYTYLTSLSGDAVPIAVRAVLSPPPSSADSLEHSKEVIGRCVEAGRLLTKWGAASDSVRRSWTTWNYGQAIGRRAVRTNEAALKAIACAPAPVPAPTNAVHGEPH
jgi:hypothetical protein